MAIVLTGLVAGFLHELINTYSYEWKYNNSTMPWTQAEFKGVPVAIFLGWIFMTGACVSVFRMTKAIRTHKYGFIGALEKEYV